MTLALGIDPGTATTGYGLVRLTRDGELIAVKYGVISTPKDATSSARLEMIYDQLCNLIKESKPDTAAVEKLYFARNVTTALAVGQARGVVMLALQKAGIEANPVYRRHWTYHGGVLAGMARGAAPPGGRAQRALLRAGRRRLRAAVQLRRAGLDARYR